MSMDETPSATITTAPSTTTESPRTPNSGPGVDTVAVVIGACIALCVLILFTIMLIVVIIMALRLKKKDRSSQLYSINALGEHLWNSLKVAVLVNFPPYTCR